MKIKLYALIVCLVAGLLHLSCSPAKIAGTGTETSTNGVVVGKIINQDATPASQTMVLLLPEEYDPVKNPSLPDSFSTTTNANGEYRFVVHDSGKYNIEAVHIGRRTRLLITAIDIRKDSTRVAEATLGKTGVIKVVLPDSVDAVDGYVYVPGTRVSTFLNGASDFVMLDSVASGVVPQINYATRKQAKSSVIRYRIPVTSQDTALVNNPAWAFEKKLILNTTTSGADVSGNVINFPVLVRLNSGNFDFSQAQPDGRDIRFVKTDNTFLSFEIERWDVANSIAEIWVNVDTVFGNNSAQCIVMHWGNASASNSSSSEAVFDTANGFQGVWHLCQPTAALTKDATANHYNGTPTSVPPVAVEGAIGIAQEFNGISSYFTMENTIGGKLDFPENGIFSVSAWVNTSVLDSMFHGIVFKSNFQYGLQIRSENSWEFMNKTSSSWEGSRSRATANSWHEITGVRNGNQQYLYVDGMCVDSGFKVITNATPRSFATNLQIGHCLDGWYDLDRYFKGQIDEVRIESTALSADRIKLTYMNQRSPDLFVQFKQ